MASFAVLAIAANFSFTTVALALETTGALVSVNNDSVLVTDTMQQTTGKLHNKTRLSPHNPIAF